MPALEETKWPRLLSSKRLDEKGEGDCRRSAKGESLALRNMSDKCANERSGERSGAVCQDKTQEGRAQSRTRFETSSRAFSAMIINLCPLFFYPRLCISPSACGALVVF